MSDEEAVEVDRDYLRALEIVVCDVSPQRADQAAGKIAWANRVIDGANLNRPRAPDE